ncbi:MAG: polysaccharide biosynthesis tyrosine autokinase [Thermoanaerobaculia bacterium]|nr:polysaccharide biosynthesis tyrosine autokinase [Thermoanaerobaculia bacterium]
MGDRNIDIKQILFKGLHYWYLFLIITPTILAGAYFYLKYAMPTYQSEALMLIKDDENSGQPTEELFFQELGMGKKNKTLENETLVLKSTPLMAEVVGFRLEIDEQQYSGEFGKELTLPSGVLTLAHKPGEYANTPIRLDIVPVISKARSLANGLKVEIIGDLSSTLSLSIKDNSPERARDILTEVMNEYNQNSVAIKNKAFENTINMVNERIKLISQNLSEAEQSVEAYKRNYSMMNLSAEGTQLLNDLASYNKEITGSEVQIEILNSIEDFLSNNRGNFEFVPTNSALNNLTLSSQLESFNNLLSVREKLRSEAGPAHPDMVLTERQIQNLRNTITDNIHNIKKDLQITSNATKGARYNLESRLQSLPRHERELINIERQKNVIENLYLYLLQKREEAAVSLAVTASKGRVVEPADAFYTPISPKGAQIWLIAIFLGIALPIGLILFLEGLNDKIQTEDDITRSSAVPLAGTLGLSRNKNRVIVTENSHTAVAEMFRLLRANLAYISPGNELKSIIVTSSTSGEGKSFIALNLGMTMALTGKKVLIVELDLRKPKQELYHNVERSEEGLVNYLINPKTPTYKIIRNTGLHQNLDLISSGPIPPNPGELIMSPHLRLLIDEMREKYDFIILDAPPVGRVADALQMKDLAEATMYVVRAGYTYKGQLEIVEDIAAKDKMPKPFIVLNGVPINKPGYGGKYGYGYGYGYGKGKGYYEKEKKAPKVKQKV